MNELKKAGHETPKRQPFFLGTVPLKKVDIKYEGQKPKGHAWVLAVPCSLTGQAL